MAVMIEDKAKPLRQCTDNVLNKESSEQNCVFMGS